MTAHHPPAAARTRTALVRALVRRAVGPLPLTLRTPDGTRLGSGGPLLDVHRPDAFHRRLGAAGLAGLGDSYRAGEWDAADLVGVLTVLARQAVAPTPPGARAFRLLAAFGPPRRGAEGARHEEPPGGLPGGLPEELPEEFSVLFLDPTMTCSSAIFPELPGGRADFPAAQRRKTDRLLDLAEVAPGSRLLELGTGRGELALRAAARGATVHTVTRDPDQLETARRRVAAAGHARRVTVAFADYREISGRYDAVVAAEPGRAAGEDRWPDIVRTLERVLAPGGRMALQLVTAPHGRPPEPVFPGGPPPAPRSVEETIARDTRLRVTASDSFGPHYAETLRLWRERFTERADWARGLGCDDAFLRRWTFRLAASEAGFRAGQLDVVQLALARRRAPRRV